MFKNAKIGSSKNIGNISELPFYYFDLFLHFIDLLTNNNIRKEILN